MQVDGDNDDDDFLRIEYYYYFCFTGENAHGGKIASQTHIETLSGKERIFIEVKTYLNNLVFPFYSKQTTQGLNCGR